MFDKRLFTLVPRVGMLVAAKVLCLWISLLADVGFAFMAVGLLGKLFPVITSNGKQLAKILNGFQAFPDDYSAFVFAFVVIVIVKYLANRAAHFFGSQASEKVKLSLRERLYEKMLDLGPSYARHVRTADVVQSMSEGVDQLQSFFELFLPQLIFSVAATLTLFVVLLPINTFASLVLLACVPLLIGVVALAAVDASKVLPRYWGAYTDMGGMFLDNIQGLETLKTFDADGVAAKHMESKSEGLRKMTMRLLKVQLRSLSTVDLVAYTGAAAGIGVAVWQVFSGRLGLPAAMVIVLLSITFFTPLRRLGSYFYIALNGLTSTKRIFSILDAPVADDGQMTLPRDAHDFSITFNNVEYTYEPFDQDGLGADTAASDANNGNNDNGSNVGDVAGKSGKSDKSDTSNTSISAKTGASAATSNRHALTSKTVRAMDGASFSVRAGRLTAIVGASGSGKSTAASLIAGTNRVYGGSLRLGYRIFDSVSSCEVRSLRTRSLADTVTLVSAQNHLFEGTLRENLLMAKPTATANEMWLALDDARIDDYVYSQPGGLDMRIEQDASNLSSGQRQRLAIARALLRDSPVYVFDEATSSVDAESERLIESTIRSLARTHTVIMVTHHLAEAAKADDIVVFDAGHVAEEGTHAELMATNGIYAEMYRDQEMMERITHRDGWSLHYGKRDKAKTGAAASVSSATTNGKSKSNAAAAARVPSADAVSSATHGNVRAQHGSDANSTSIQASSPSKPMGTFRVVRRLLSEVGPLMHWLVAACLLGSISQLAGTFLPVFGVMAFAAGFGHPIWGFSLTASIVAMAVCALLRGLMRFSEQFMTRSASFRLLSLFRSKTFNALRNLAPGKLLGRGKGDLVALITEDVEQLEVFFADTIAPVVVAVVTSICYAVALWTLDPGFALLLIISHLLMGVVLPELFASSVSGIGARIREESAALDDRVLDDMRGLDEIIRFGRGSQRLKAVVSRSKELWLLQNRLSRKNGVFSGLGDVLIVFSLIAASFVALDVCQHDPSMALGCLAAVVLVASSFGPTLALSALPPNLTRTFGAARRIFAILDEAPAVEETGIAKPKYDGMELSDITFTYHQKHATPTVSASAFGADAAYDGLTVGREPLAKPVFRNFNLLVPRSGILGLQGPSGRGKSTILKLLMRYWDPQGGVVDFSGQPLPQIDAHHRRHVQTVMGQETYMFNGTIRDNLLVAKPDASEGELLRACEQASLKEFVDSLPDGLDTCVEELGARLSEGERQRVGLARVFLTDASLILFDEPTSRVDALSEAVILRSINELASKRDVAIVLVSHRESTMRIADRVLTV
ncbi:ATP-binding cassette domain-containing protein [Bifidobacterium sp. ESL0790]|uniref:ATP-binding cassette domain-containing protein n=1 Tax=Bifidobacterium sp. ESL0790 TaxID=2983233 RepID=UPI0023F61DC5|nr:ATP-binding cassette domain-containing protein [Bifidobacterium sp. ESL0790]WEV72210.1 ATP-binding cassette domain-containing protein [Bifidobacterium sp. ESL0790]